jgi:hypothetical protein
MRGNYRVAGWAVGLGACLAAVLLVSLPSRGASPPKFVQLHVTAVRASQQGEESIDPQLGELGPKLQKKYKAKRLEVIGEETCSATSHIELITHIGDDMELRIRWGGANSQGIADFTIWVMRGKEAIIPRSHLRIQLNEMALLDGRLDRDALILVLTAQSGDE